LAIIVPLRLTGGTAERPEHRNDPDRVQEVSTAMNMIDRLRHRRNVSRQHRAIDRALRSAPTQAMRNELLMIAQRFDA
jgi:hypothetical protein